MRVISQTLSVNSTIISTTKLLVIHQQVISQASSTTHGRRRVIPGTLLTMARHNFGHSPLHFGTMWSHSSPHRPNPPKQEATGRILLPIELPTVSMGQALFILGLLLTRQEVKLMFANRTCHMLSIGSIRQIPLPHGNCVDFLGLET